MIGFRIDPDGPLPPSTQVVEALLDALATGRFEVGERLPSVRALAADLDVNTNTVGRVYAELERLGVVEGRPGSGIYVAPRARSRAARLRRAATLDDFRRAAALALRAGHRRADLEQALVAIETCADGPGPRTRVGTP